MSDLSILYTTAASIRATIGLDDADMDDDALAALNLDMQMRVTLSGMLPDYETLYTESSLKAFQLSLWCQYFGALFIVELGPLGIAQKYQANNDQWSRFNNIDWDALKQSLKAWMKKIEDLLKNPTALETAKRFSIMGKSTPDYDPIIGPQ